MPTRITRETAARDDLAEQRTAREVKQPYASEIEDRETEKILRENSAPEERRRRKPGAKSEGAP